MLVFRCQLTRILARRDPVATYTAEPETWRPEHPHTVARKRHHNTHFRSHLEQHFRKPE
jgi:hypothetical protein